MEKRIMDKIRCKYCHNTLEIPVDLPCGTTVCQKHISSIFVCIGCENNHVIPVSGFVRNQAIEKLIEALPRLDFNNVEEEYTKAMQSCQSLDSIINDVDLLRRDPQFYIHEAFGQLKQKIDIKRELLKEEIDREAANLLNEMATHELACQNRASGIVEGEHWSWHVMDEIRQNLAEWMNVMSVLVKDKVEWRNVQIECENSAQCLNIKSDVLRKELMINKLDHFQVRQREFDNIKIINPYYTRFPSNLLDYEMRSKLMSLCRFPLEQKWRLLYSSRNKFSANDFHEKCGGGRIENTLVIIKTNQHNIFGGFTTKSWEKKGYKEDRNAFLFSLVNGENTPLKMHIKPGREKYAIISSKDGFAFGLYDKMGQDLVILDSEIGKSSSCLGSCYKHPSYNYGSAQANRFLAGQNQFDIDNIEIFEKLDD